MKLILAQPAIKRFQWELEVLLTNIKQFADFEVILLFTQNDDTVPQYLADKYGARCFVYADRRIDKSYIPSVRPWLLWQYFKRHPEPEQYFYIDSDVIFREWPKLGSLAADPTHWYGSDCSGYIAVDYILNCERGMEIAQRMAQITGINVEQMKGVPGIGAHLLLTNPTAAFWERAYDDSNKIWHYFETIDSNIQKWTAEMWAQLWGMVREGITPVTNSELDFCMATDNVKMWDVVKIMHNAGAIDDHELFFKGKYVEKTPFEDNLDYVRKDRVSSKYVEAIKSVIV